MSEPFFQLTEGQFYVVSAMVCAAIIGMAFLSLLYDKNQKAPHVLVAIPAALTLFAAILYGMISILNILILVCK